MKPLDWFYITLICALGAVTFWGAFDIRHRYHDVLLAQALVLFVRVFWRASRR